MSSRVFFSLLAGVLLLSSCGSEPKKTTTVEAAKPPEKKEVSLLTARPCLERMEYMALKWQPDAHPYHVESVINAESNGQDGKATVWKANFASASRGLSRTYMCSGSLLKESPAYGVTANREYPYTAGATVLTFTAMNVMVDSDTVAKLAREHGGADLIKRDPKQPVFYELGMDAKTNKLLWAAVYGPSQKDNKGIAMIDAHAPNFLGVFRH